MSQVYSTEPAPTGRVILTTTHGPIDINLFCKECPTTTRSFLQLCLDGFYDGVLFHRILPEFLIQTGLTRGPAEDTVADDVMDEYLRGSSAVSSASSMTGDVLGWERKRLELSPRIRFNHRGQVAAALPLTQSGHGDDGEHDKMLRYQFFITLDESPFLDGNHVIFGTIVGPTIFNAIRIGKTEVDEATGCPMDMTDSPPKIVSVKVDYHPFDDLVVTSERNIPWKLAKAGEAGEKGLTEQQMRKKKRKGKRDFNVLSFGDEERDYHPVVSQSGEGGSETGGTMKSSHDVLSHESSFLSSTIDAAVRKKMTDVSNGEPQMDRFEVGVPINNDRVPESDDTGNDNERQLKRFSEDRPVETTESLNNTDYKSTQSEKKKQLEHVPPSKSKPTGEVEARRAKYLKNGCGTLASKKERLKREDDTMSKLLAFRTKVLNTKAKESHRDNSRDMTKGVSADDALASRMAKRMKQAADEDERIRQEKDYMTSKPGYNGLLDEEGSDISDNEGVRNEDWMGVKFKCKRHVDHDSRMAAVEKTGSSNNPESMVGGDGRSTDDYLVVDGNKRVSDERHDSHRKRHGQRHEWHTRCRGHDRRGEHDR